MGIYTDRVLPHLVDRVCGQGHFHKLRARVCVGLTGDLLEVGFGTGLNISHYPDDVASVAAVEPSNESWKIARKRVEGAPVTVERSGLEGESLPFADDSFDSALSTWTMCTIPDLPAALAEIRRVLKPGGRLHFVEHGLAPDEGVQRWQRRLEPLQKRWAGGCHFTRQIATQLTDAGFEIVELDEFYDPSGPRFATWFSLGVAAG